MIVASVTRTTKRRQLSALHSPSSSERATHLKRRRGTRSHNSIRPLRSPLPGFREFSLQTRETSRFWHLNRHYRFVASLKLCLGLRIAAGRTSGRAWDFSWQFVSELPGKKKSSRVGWADESYIVPSRVIYALGSTTNNDTGA